MAYQTGVSASVDDLLNAIRVFAVANGWTQNGYAVDGDGYRLHLQKGAQFVDMRSGGVSGFGYVGGTTTHSPWPAIRLYGSTGYNGASAWDAQPGRAANGAVSNDMGDGPMTYWLFTAADAVYCVAEVVPGIFKHLAFGLINKICTFTGGAFVCGAGWYSYIANSSIHTSNYQSHRLPFDAGCQSSGSCQLRADIDGNTDYWFDFKRDRVAGAARSVLRDRPAYGPALNDWQFDRSPSVLNGQNILQHLHCFVWRPGGNWSLLGWPPGLRLVNLSSLAPKQEITIGPETWMVFPVIQKNGANYTPNSDVLGYAYRKEV